MNPTAIIADDEQHLSEYLKTRLNALWPELNILALAANGPEALRLIDDHVPDIVFLDIRMPGLTGLEVAGRIDAKTRIVFVTAFDQYAVDAFDKQAVDYLLKPVADDRLIRAIAGCVGAVEILSRHVAAGEEQFSALYSRLGR
jgi:DNA-binding LytR/AlgR family response regulator